VNSGYRTLLTSLCGLINYRLIARLEVPLAEGSAGASVFRVPRRRTWWYADRFIYIVTSGILGQLHSNVGILGHELLRGFGTTRAYGLVEMMTISIDAMTAVANP
jgi:hypothetical protein